MTPPSQGQEQTPGHDSPTTAPSGSAPTVRNATGDGQGQGPTALAPEIASAFIAEAGTGSMLGHYKLLEKIGEGGCGVVYVAEQIEPVRRRVALKLIKPGADTRQVVARFEAERQALAMMDHPNIAKILDAGMTGDPNRSAGSQPAALPAGSRQGVAKPSAPSPHPASQAASAAPRPTDDPRQDSSTSLGRPFFVMELVRGIRITDYCDQHQLTTRERLELFVCVCGAIQHAHQKGIIHRDIKPSNILVTVQDAVPVPKVIDFGIAKAVEGRLTNSTVYTQLHQFIGTPAYMSPEQAEMSGLDIDTRSDIYSLGVLLYELLTGRPPFDPNELLALGFDAMRRTIREREPARPSTRLANLAVEELTTTAKRRSTESARLLHHLRGDLDWIVMRCLEKDRTRRYETANGLAADIRRHLANEPVLARPPSAGYRLQKAIRRNRLAFAAGALIALSLVIGLGAATVLFFRERSARADEQQQRQKADAARAAAETAGQRAEEQRQRAETNAVQLLENLYFHQVALAHRELTARPPNIDVAEDLLEACPASFRDWEWHYLKRQWRAEPWMIRQPGLAAVNGLAISRDGRFIACACGDGVVRIYDNTGRLEREFKAHNGFAFCVAFDPSDPARLLSAGVDRRVHLWNWSAPTAAPLRSWTTQLAFEWGLCQFAAFSPDGQRLAFAPDYDTVKIWDARSGVELQTFPGHEGGAYCVAFSPDGQWLGTGSSIGIVSLWDSRTGRELHRLGGKTPPIASLAFSHDGKKLAAGGFGGEVGIWSVDKGQPLTERIEHTLRTLGVAFSADDRRLATAAHDRTVALWEVGTGRKILTLREFNQDIQCLAFSPDGHRLFAGSVDGTIRSWDATPLDPAKDIPRTTVNHSGRISTVQISPDGKWLAVAGNRARREATARIQLSQIGTTRPPLNLAGHEVFVFDAAFSPDGRSLASTGDDGQRAGGLRAKVWDLATGELRFITEAFPANEVYFCVTYSADGRYIIAAGRDQGRMAVWDAATGRRVGILGQNGRTIFHIALSREGRYLACAGKEGRILVWNCLQPDVPQTAPREIGVVAGSLSDVLAFSPDSRRIVAIRSDDAATVWDMDTGAELLTLSAPGHGLQALAYSPDGRWIATGGLDALVHLWDAATGRRLGSLRGHKGRIVRLRFLPGNAHTLVSGSGDGQVLFSDTLTLTQRSTPP